MGASGWQNDEGRKIGTEKWGEKLGVDVAGRPCGARWRPAQGEVLPEIIFLPTIFLPSLSSRHLAARRTLNVPFPVRIPIVPAVFPFLYGDRQTVCRFAAQT